MRTSCRLAFRRARTSAMGVGVGIVSVRVSGQLCRRSLVVVVDEAHEFIERINSLRNRIPLMAFNQSRVEFTQIASIQPGHASP